MPLRKPKERLFVHLTEDRYTFVHGRFQFRNNVKHVLALFQLKRQKRGYHPGLYSVEFQRVGRRSRLVFQPVNV